MLGVSPENFEKNFSLVLEESKHRNNEFVFINAWNEWGEGMYLEPDEKHGFEYLKAVLRSLERIKNEDGTKNVSSNNNENQSFKHNRNWKN